MALKNESDLAPQIEPQNGSQEWSQMGPQMGTQKGTQMGPQMGPQTAPINKHKHKLKTKIEEPKGSMSSRDDFEESVRRIFFEFNLICKNCIPAKIFTDKRRRFIGGGLAGAAVSSPEICLQHWYISAISSSFRFYI